MDSSLCMFVSSSSNVSVFVLFYIIFYYCPIEACLFPNEKQKGNGSGWDKKGGIELGGVAGRNP